MYTLSFTSILLHTSGLLSPFVNRLWFPRLASFLAQVCGIGTRFVRDGVNVQYTFVVVDVYSGDDFLALAQKAVTANFMTTF